MTPFFRRTVVVLISVLALLAPGSLAHAATGKAEVLSGWTQPTAASTAAWNAARLDRTRWSSYGFDWSTDHCSFSPDNPLGFTFAVSCRHHDFGYRNYKAIGQFSANKTRLDNTFYADLERECATYSVVVQPACHSLAWTYYRAAHVFGSLAGVQQADIEEARRLRN